MRNERANRTAELPRGSSGGLTNSGILFQGLKPPNLSGLMPGLRLRHPKTAALKERRQEAGYTLLLAVFIAATMIIAASVAVPNLITQDRRQKEKLMIWRGQQYARAIGLYYRKTGHFPHDLEELEKGVAGIHFLRQPYKDPMNSADGSWRLIYLGAGGQLIGSLCWHSLAEYEAAQMGVPLLSTATPLAASGNGSAGFGAASSMSSAFAPATPSSGSAQATDEAGTTKPLLPPTCAMFGQGPSSSAHPQIITEGRMIGGNLIGVASEVDQASIKNYMGADNYRYWEFIWNPQQGQQTATPAIGPLNGQNPLGTGKTLGPSGAPNPPPPAPMPLPGGMSNNQTQQP